jgi:hypothetical protein
MWLIELSNNPCDIGTNLEILSKEFPTIDFSDVDKAYPRKTGRYAYSESAALRRGQDGLRWLRSRPEKVIAIVSHASFLRTCIAKCYFWNADYRIFDFEDREDGILMQKEWPETKANGGWLGREDSEPSGILLGDFTS